MIHTLIPCIYLLDGKAVTGFGQKNLFGDGDPVKLAKVYSERGADGLLVFDFSNTDAEHEAAIECIRCICEASQVPVSAAGNIKGAEDVKKLLYAGCREVVLNGSKPQNLVFLEDVSTRFGKERISVSISEYQEYEPNRELIESFASSILLLDADDEAKFEGKTTLRILLHRNDADYAEILGFFRNTKVTGVSGNFVSDPATDLMDLKLKLKNEGITMDVMVSSIPWSEFTKNANGLVPCIVQDARNDEVLMMAWMNEESFNLTLITGKMTYYSRSRQELWLKGLTSGHFQYVKSLSIDCDRDTMLAKVYQVGAACHTGNRSCFYTTLAEKDGTDANPYHVFEDVMKVILDRKEHPKEGSYTNYLFDKGLDKILKKVGEENTEVIIAAKNQSTEELKYEISDYLYHLMVLMAEKGVSWEEVTAELARR